MDESYSLALGQQPLTALQIQKYKIFIKVFQYFQNQWKLFKFKSISIVTPKIQIRQKTPRQILIWQQNPKLKKYETVLLKFKIVFLNLLPKFHPNNSA